MVELREEDVQLLQEIYRDAPGRTKVYFAKLSYNRASVDVAVKVITCRNSLELYSFIEECLNQLRIDSPNICRIYGWIIKDQEIQIVMERLVSNLAKEIELRRKAAFYYSERELLGLMWDIGQVFAKLQRIQVSHNDIKPENIFVQKLEHGQVRFKVGDFGSSAKIVKWEQGLAGTPLYLSPKLKVEYNRFLTTKERRTLVHDTYKSDVYSFGVTVIYLAELVCPHDLQNLNQLQQNLNNHIDNIRYRYPIVAGLLSDMVATDETKRYDFLKLEERLTALPELSAYISQRFDSGFPCLESLKDDELGFLATLQTCYETGEWEFMKTVLDIHCEQLASIAVECIPQMCPHCYLEPGTDSVCQFCQRPTGFARDNVVR